MRVPAFSKRWYVFGMDGCVGNFTTKEEAVERLRKSHMDERRKILSLLPDGLFEYSSPARGYSGRSIFWLSNNVKLMRSNGFEPNDHGRHLNGCGRYGCTEPD